MMSGEKRGNIRDEELVRRRDDRRGERGGNGSHSASRRRLDRRPDRGRGLPGAAAGRDGPSGPEWHLAESHHRKLGHRGPRRRARTISGPARRVGRPARGAEHRGGRRAAVQAGGAGAAERKPRAAPGRRPVQPPHRGRSGSQVLRARRSAGDVHALPVPDRPDAGKDPDGLRVQQHFPLHPA